jgi:hypothetical protein
MSGAQSVTIVDEGTINGKEGVLGRADDAAPGNPSKMTATGDAWLIFLYAAGNDVLVQVPTSIGLTNDQIVSFARASPSPARRRRLAAQFGLGSWTMASPHLSRERDRRLERRDQPCLPPQFDPPRRRIGRVDLLGGDIVVRAVQPRRSTARVRISRRFVWTYRSSSSRARSSRSRAHFTALRARCGAMVSTP